MIWALQINIVFSSKNSDRNAAIKRFLALSYSKFSVSEHQAKASSSKCVKIDDYTLNCITLIVVKETYSVKSYNYCNLSNTIKYRQS